LLEKPYRFSILQGGLAVVIIFKIGKLIGLKSMFKQDFEITNISVILTLAKKSTFEILVSTGMFASLLTNFL
jgi:hypothetical protein